MRIYKAEYKDRSGKQKKAAKWYLDFSDHNQLRHKIPALTDKRSSEELGRNIESLVNCRISGLELDVKLNQWIETVPDNLLKKFVSWGLIEGQRTEFAKPLSEHITDYVNVLKAKGFAKAYIRHTQNRLIKIIADLISFGIFQRVQLKYISESCKKKVRAKQQPDIIYQHFKLS